MSEKLSNSGKNTSIQVLKGFGAIIIFLFHGKLPFFMEHLNITAIALNLFFVLSGFMMAYSYRNKDIEVSPLDSIKFGIKKIGSLYGLHIIMAIPFILLLVMQIVKKPGTIGINLLTMVLNLTLTQCWAVKDTVVLGMNSPAWFLSNMMFLYMAFPFIWKKVKGAKSNKSLYITAAVLLCVKYMISLLLVLFNADLSFIWWVNDISPIGRVFDFTLALIAGRIFFTYIENNEGQVFGKVKATILEIVFIALAVVIGIANTANFNNVVLKALFTDYTVVFMFISIPLAILFYSCEGMITRLLNHQPFIYFGEVSSYFYLIHYFFVCLVMLLIELSVGALPWKIKSVCLAIMFLITFALSALANRIYKKKAAKKKSK